jgi:hypothetical protein
LKKLITLLALFLAGAAFGIASAQNVQPQTSYSTQILAGNPSVYLTFNNPAAALRENQSGVSFTASGVGSITANQVGFDNTQPNNTAAAFTYNAYAYAPNSTLGSFEWYQPFSVVFQIDRFNWARSGTKVLMTKGATNGSYYQLTAIMNGTVANFCIQIYARGALTSPNAVNEETCTPAAVDMANGLNYSIAAGSDGTGQTNTTGLWITVNGLGLNTASSFLTRFINGGGSYGLGGVNPTISGGTGYLAYEPFNAVGGGPNCTVYGAVRSTSGTPASVATAGYLYNYGCTSAPTLTFAPYAPELNGGGTGYAASTPFTSTGGGAGCSMAGTMTASGGVPNNITTTQDTGVCTSAPTIVLTAPTGTGGVPVATAITGSGITLTAQMENATLLSTGPLVLSGSYNGSTYSGSTAVTTDPPIIIDTFAVFPAQLTLTQIHSIFYQTKFYQGLLKTVPAVPYTLIFDNDGTGDPDDVWALAATIAAERLGFIRLAAVSSTTNDGTAAALYRNMLDQAGLAHIPVCVPSSFTINSSTSSSVSSPIYNSATSQTVSVYPQCSTVFRKVFAANPTTPVFIMLAGTFRSTADWMQSGADSISSLTGLQQVAQNATNGGAIYVQGLVQPPHSQNGGDNSFLDWTAGQYVFANNGTMPILAFGGSPQETGPGASYTRNAKDPVFLYAAHFGSDERSGFDSLPTLNFMSAAFSAPVTLTIGSGGTGYATTQAFTLSGGGPNCTGSGTITSVSGVLTTINYPNTLYPTYFGFGSGCTSVPTVVLTAPSGTGATVTASTLYTCGTFTITGAALGNITTTCGNQYFVNPSQFTALNNEPVMQWFLNSLIDVPPNGAPRPR